MSDEFAELLMPFVTVMSKGGPHDDDAYVAGWEMAQLDNRLAYAAFGAFTVPPTTLHRANLPQVALIAMKHGFVDRVIEWDEDDYNQPQLDPETRAQWVLVEFVYGGSGTHVPDGGTS